MKHLNPILRLLLLFFVLFSFSAHALTFNKRVSASNDDAEEFVGSTEGSGTGYMYRNSSDLELVFDDNQKQQVGMRFTGVTIPRNAYITNAYIEFTVDEADSGTTNVVISGQAIDDAPEFHSANYDISSRTLTTASVAWNDIPAWSGWWSAKKTPDLSSIVQEIVNRGGWSSNNDMAFIVKAGSNCSGSGCQRTAVSYDGSFYNDAPLLHIEYFVPTIDIAKIVNSNTGVQVYSSGGGTPNLHAGQTYTITMDYHVSQPRDITTGFQVNHNPWNGWNYHTVQVPAGYGSVDINVTIPPDTDLSDTYQIPATVRPVGGDWHNTMATDTVNPVNILAPITIDKIISIDSLSVVRPGDVITVIVGYNVSQARDVTAGFQQDHGPWEGWDWQTVTVEQGMTQGDQHEGNVTYQITIPSEATLNDANLSTYGWSNAYRISTTVRPVGTTYEQTIHTYTKGPITVVLNVLAVNDSLSTQPGTPITANVISNDKGYGINITSTSQPTQGSVTFDANGNITYTPDANSTGNDSFTYTITDYFEDNSTATVTITDAFDFNSSNPRDFEKVLINGNQDTNIYGDLTIIGNQSLCWKNGTSTCQEPSSTASNNGKKQENINEDPAAAAAGYVNSTSADLVLGADDEVVDAWLYWTGRVKTNNATGPAKRAIANRIYLKTPDTNGAYIKLYSDGGKFAWMVGNDNVFDYGGAVNVKEYVKQGGTYWVADLQATEMKNQGSGWALAVVIRDTTNGDVRSIKNISLYDGFVGVYNSTGYPATVTEHIAGFKTPLIGDVNSNLIIVGGESDRSLDDRISITDKDGTAHYLSDSFNDTHDILNGTISRNGQNVTDRNPNFANTLGWDIDEIDVSDIIQNNQTETDITFKSEGDRIFLSVLGFATELYQPNVCYDYALKRNDIIVPADDRHYDIPSASTSDEISFTIAIWDISGDLDLKKVTVGLHVEGTLSAMLTENKAYFSLPNAGTLLPTDYASMSTHKRPVIAIGEGRDADTGGIIYADERYFMKYYFNPTTSGALAGDFTVDINATMNFGSGDFWQILNVHRCPQNPAYNPEWYQFNVERYAPDTSLAYPPIYSLPTRIAKKEFDYSIASYTKDVDEKYTVPTIAADITIDTEMIDINAFDDNGSYLKCINPDPSIIMAPGEFAYFEDVDRIQIDIGDAVNHTGDSYAARNTTFRMWLLVDGNDTIITDADQHPKTDNAYFEGVYNDNYAVQDFTGLCTDACASPYNYTSERLPYDPSATGCYACLRDYFARAACARDNFAIRPDEFRVFGKNQFKRAGEDFNVTLKAVNENNNTDNIDEGLATDVESVQRYNASLSELNITHSVFMPNSDQIANMRAYVGYNDVTTCPHPGTFNFDGNKSFDNGEINVTMRYSETNILELNVSEELGKEWALVDVNDTPWSVRQITPSSENEDELDIFERTIMLFNPYSFKTEATYDTTNGKSWLYMNNVSGSTHPMSAYLDYTITAYNKQGEITKNFTKTCFPDTEEPSDGIEVNGIKLNTTFDLHLHAEINSSAVADIGVSVEDNNSIGIYVEDANVLLQEGNNSLLSYIYPWHFSNGIGRERVYFNIGREINAAKNPVRITVVEVNSTINWDNSAAPNDFNGTELNSSKTFVYGRTKSSQYFYDNVTESSKITPVSILVYCDFGLNGCQDIGLVDLASGTLSDAQSNEASWWYAQNHETNASDGTVTLSSSSNGMVSPAAPNSISTTEGIDSAVTVTNTSSNTPNIVEISFDKVTTSPWLIYNKDGNNTDEDENWPSPFYKVRFIGAGSGWTGHGKTGHVVDDNVNKSKSRRTEW